MIQANLRLVVSIAKNYATGPAGARPDPGGHPRPDPGGREVRLAPRLQVLDLRDLVDPPGRRARPRRQARTIRMPVHIVERCRSSSRAPSAGSGCGSGVGRPRRRSRRRRTCRCRLLRADRGRPASSLARPWPFSRTVSWSIVPPSVRRLEIPAGRLGQVRGIELVHPEHPGEAEHPRRDDPVERVRRRPGGRAVRSVEMVALDLERPRVGEDVDDVTNGRLIGQGFGRPSTTTSMDGRVVLVVAMTQRSSAARLRAFRVPSPARRAWRRRSRSRSPA